MQFTCTLFNINLTNIFKVTFCTIYEIFIHIVPKSREISVSHIPQRTPTYTQTHTHTHTNTHEQQGIYIL
jgi:hypothetical protein